MTANIVPIARNQQVQQLYKTAVMGCHLKWSAVFPTAGWVLEGTENLLPGCWVWQDLMVLTSATFAMPQSKILKRANRTHPGCWERALLVHQHIFHSELFNLSAPIMKSSCTVALWNPKQISSITVKADQSSKQLVLFLIQCHVYHCICL